MPVAPIRSSAWRCGPTIGSVVCTKWLKVVLAGHPDPAAAKPNSHHQLGGSALAVCGWEGGNSRCAVGGEGVCIECTLSSHVVATEAAVEATTLERRWSYSRMVLTVVGRASCSIRILIEGDGSIVMFGSKAHTPVEISTRVESCVRGPPRRARSASSVGDITPVRAVVGH